MSLANASSRLIHIHMLGCLLELSLQSDNHSSFRDAGMDGREGKPGARGPKGEVG